MANSILQKDFYQWISSLDSSYLNNTDKKLLNLFIQYLGDIASCGIGGGKRATLIGKLIENTHNDLSTEVCLDDLKHSQNQKKQFNYQISEISIGPFRGFTSNETFKLDKKYTFMYGPNGSGKTSFCEGIEYALLGGIEEANSKRIPLEKYAKNSLIDGYTKPNLYTIDADGTKVAIEPNPTIFRFAFIERNRIDGFARITAESPRNQRDKIVTLFGLDAFSNFVDGFTDNFDYRYINLDNPKVKELDKKSEEISYSKTRISDIEVLLETNETDTQKLLNDLDSKSKRILKAKTDNELDRYNKIRNSCNRFINDRKSLIEERDKLQKDIDQFNQKHKTFIEEIKKENKKIETHQQLVDSYCKLISSLKKYRDDLPLKLASGLSELSVEFYNTRILIISAPLFNYKANCISW